MATVDDSLTTQEAADFLEVSRFRVHQFYKDGRLKARKFGRALVFRLAELREFKSQPRLPGRRKKS